MDEESERVKSCSECPLAYFQWRTLSHFCSKFGSAIRRPRLGAKDCEYFSWKKDFSEYFIEGVSWPRHFLPEIYHYREF